MVRLIKGGREGLEASILFPMQLLDCWLGFANSRAKILPVCKDNVLKYAFFYLDRKTICGCLRVGE